MSDDLEAELAAALGEASLEEMIDKSAVATIGQSLEPDTKLTGKVLRVTPEYVFVDLPGMNQGAIQTLLFEERVPEVGQALEVRVGLYLPDEGIYECSSGNSAMSVSDWSQVAEGMVVEAKITGHNKGGLECDVNRIRGFIPAGQISLYRIEDFSGMVGEKLTCVITLANPERRNLVLSRKAVLEREQEEAKTKLLAELSVGDEREGIVRSLRDFGAFVDLGGVDGLIHISQMSWERIRHPKELLTEGQRVKVKVQKIDPDSGKISLSLRDFVQNPWDSAAQKYAVGTKVKGTVTRIMEFGAFVKLEPGVEGLVHVSELSFKCVWRVGDVLSEGQEVEAKVLSVDPEKQRISLSIKAYEAHPEPEAETEVAVETAEEVAAKPVPKRTVPLKGGLGKSSGGEEVGLKW
ncbi:MAG: S1 RNA-binding domain-containing protein [Pirellulales bacterium]